MITKLWSLLMLKLSRLIVAVKNAVRKKEPINKTEIPTSSEEIAHEELRKTIATLRKRRKAICESHDYCEECGYYFFIKCLFADDDEGIPCYWEVDE